MVSRVSASPDLGAKKSGTAEGFRPFVSSARGQERRRVFFFPAKPSDHFAGGTNHENPNQNQNHTQDPVFAAFSVGAVLFSAHAGGGFATGNQANTYYVGLGWAGIVSAIVAMLLLTLTMREAMIMYNSRGLTSYKQLFETLYHPFDKIEWLFEIFFYIMVLMAVAAAISGAASALRSYFGVNYYLGVVAVGCLVLLLTIFGAGIVRAASTYMGIAILVTAITIYAIGIFKSESPLFTVLSADFRTTGFANVPKAIFNAFTYAGFQCVTLPTMIACGTTMRSKQGCAKAMWISFVMNAVALVLSVFMLICWRGVYTAVDGGTTIPTLTVCNSMGIRALTAVYGVCLMLCLISTGVTTIFGFVARFEKLPMFRGIQSAPVRSAIVSAFIIICPCPSPWPASRTSSSTAMATAAISASRSWSFRS